MSIVLPVLVEVDPDLIESLGLETWSPPVQVRILKRDGMYCMEARTISDGHVDV